MTDENIDVTQPVINVDLAGSVHVVRTVRVSALLRPVQAVRHRGLHAVRLHGRLGPRIRRLQADLHQGEQDKTCSTTPTATPAIEPRSGTRRSCRCSADRVSG
jgi:hypothetical protein